MTRRTEKIASVLMAETGKILNAMKLPAMTTITKVDPTPDLKQAKVYISILSNTDAVKLQVLEQIESNRYRIQGILNRKLTMRLVPKVEFIVDDSAGYAAHIDELIKQNK